MNQSLPPISDFGHMYDSHSTHAGKLSPSAEPIQHRLAQRAIDTATQAMTIQYGRYNFFEGRG